jgi:hypothetical protein
MIGHAAGDSRRVPYLLPQRYIVIVAPLGRLPASSTFHLPHTAPDLVGEVAQLPVPVLRTPTQLQVRSLDLALVRYLRDLPHRRGELVEILGHRLQLFGGEQAPALTEVPGSEGDRVEEIPEPLEGVPVVRVGELGQEGLPPDGLAVELR